MDEQDKFDAMASSMEMMLMLEPMLSAIANYRQRLIDMGFAESSAETMTVEFHRVLMTKAIGGL